MENQAKCPPWETPDISTCKVSLGIWSLTLRSISEKHLGPKMPHSHLQDNYAHSNKFKSTTELAALNCGPNVTWTPALHNMRLGSPRNCKIDPPPTHCVLEWCPAHIDAFKLFSPDVWQHQNSSESSAQKAQQQLRKDSLEFWKKECTIICNSLSLCYLQFSLFVSENTKLNLRITALVSQWAAQRQVLVDMHTWAAVTLLFRLPQSTQQTYY